MPRLTLRRKLLLFAIAIAVAPILLAGQTIIRIAQDELKSSANEQLLGIAGGIAREVNDVVERSWLEPLVLLRNALDDDQLGVQEKIALLTLGISDITDIVALQLTVEGTDLPLVVVQNAFSARLRAAGLDPLEVLRVPPESVGVLRGAADVLAQDVTPVAATDDWLATVVLPLSSRIAGADATLTARIDLHRLRELVGDDPFTRSGFITVVDRTGHEVFDPERRDLGGYAIVAEAIGALSSTSRSLGVSPYPRPDGEVMLGAYAFPRPFKWAVLVERRQRDAYLAVERMTRSLVLWGSAGLAVAVLGAIALAFAISRPILEIDRVAAAVAGGDLTARVVRGVRLNDEIGGLARRINGMIVGLTERLHLRQEAMLAGRMQQAILPRRFPSSANFAVHAEAHPAAEVGGDFYDVFELPDGHLAFLIADVSGKGMAAALFMAVAHTVMRATALTVADDPALCLTRANALLAADNEAAMFVTLFYGVLDPASGVLRYANAGHNPPLLVPMDSTVRRLEPTGDPPLGALEEVSYSSRSERLAKGDILFLYTDGVTEAFTADNRAYGEAQLCRHLWRLRGLHPRQVVEQVVDDVRSFVQGADPSDDLTCLAIAVGGAVMRESADTGASSG